VASSGPSPTGPFLPCAEGSRAGHRTAGGVSLERDREADALLALLLEMQLKEWLAFWAASAY